MKLKPVMLLTLIMTLICSSAWCQEATYEQGVSIFVETGVTPPDRIPTWYAPMVAMPYAPVFEILATKGTQGRYYQRTYAVTIKDIIKWHGHDCEGITHVANCCKVAFEILFPDGIVDRSVLKGISGTSPCWSDGLAFLSGARLQYGNLGFFKKKDYNHAVILYREDTGVAVLATWKKGINNIPDEPVVLPGEITWTPEIDMQDVVDLKKVVKSSQGKPDPYDVDLLRYYQWRHVNDILGHPLNESYQAEVIENFKWEDWVDSTKIVPAPHKRGDIRLKNYPYRERPVLKKK
jgi:formylmethanofuran dehydrogenase subunit E